MTHTPYPAETYEQYRKLTTASVSDALQALGVRGYVSSSIRRLTGGVIAGPAITVQEVPAEVALPPEHALAAIDDATPGSVMVIANNAEPDVAVWGGLMTAGATARGIVGVVTDAGVRDLSEIERDFDFTVFARTSTPATTVGRFRTISTGEPVVVGGVTVRQLDLVFGDRDGVVIVPQDHVTEVLAAAVEIEAREAAQTKLILETGSLAAGLAMYNRI